MRITQKKVNHIYVRITENESSTDMRIAEKTKRAYLRITESHDMLKMQRKRIRRAE